MQSAKREKPKTAARVIVAKSQPPHGYSTPGLSAMEQSSNQRFSTAPTRNISTMLQVLRRSAAPSHGRGSSGNPMPLTEIPQTGKTTVSQIVLPFYQRLSAAMQSAKRERPAPSARRIVR